VPPINDGFGTYGQTQTVQQAATNSDGEAPWADLEVAIERPESRVARRARGSVSSSNDSRTGGGRRRRPAGVGTKRTQYVAVDDVGEQFQKRHFDSRLGWHETTVPRETVRDGLITKVTRSAVSPPERTREAASQRAKHVHREASSGTPDSITDTLNQHSGPVLARCWLTTFRIHVLNPAHRPVPPRRYRYRLSRSATGLTLPAVAVYQRRKPCSARP